MKAKVVAKTQVIRISKEVHKKIKVFCAEHGEKLIEYADFALINQLESYSRTKKKTVSKGTIHS